MKIGIIGAGHIGGTLTRRLRACQDFDAAGVRAALSQSQQERTAQWTATTTSPGTFDAPL